MTGRSGSAPGTIVIAEAGVNHNGELALARRLVEAAAVSGADYVKFQTFRADQLTTHSASKASYQKRSSDPDESQHEMLRRLELTPAMHEAVIEHCAAHSIRFLSSPFDVESVHLLAGLGVELFKIPSGEIDNLPYLRAIGRYARPVIVSTGMATIPEIRACLEILERAGTPRSGITILHCNTEYPTPMADVNLRAMATLRDTFGLPVGYSDHTLGIEVPIAAVALGATVIEKHLTLDRGMPGPDHRASLEPAELGAMVAAIRNIEAALGNGVKQPSPSEAKNRPTSRKSIVASRAVRAGETFTEENVTVKRPGGGLSPMRWDDVIGRTARRDYAADEPIDL